jgi:putative SOS response-associated peptidase YedK
MLYIDMRFGPTFDPVSPTKTETHVSVFLLFNCLEMCYSVQQSNIISAVEKRFTAKVEDETNFLLSDSISGFAHENVPVITAINPGIIATNYHWGLVPSWCTNLDMRKQTLNARIETAASKPAFSEAVNNRCLVIASGFYEWRWLDEKGRNKEKYIIHSADDEIMCFAGIYSIWANRETGEKLRTFSIVTTEANETMSFVHNNKKRMPVVLRNSDESAWLDASNEISNFAFPKYNPNLLAFKL